MTAREFNKIVKSLNLRQWHVASMLGCETRTVRRWQRGDRPIPPAVAKLMRLANWRVIAPSQIELAGS